MGRKPFWCLVGMLFVGLALTGCHWGQQHRYPHKNTGGVYNPQTQGKGWDNRPTGNLPGANPQNGLTNQGITNPALLPAKKPNGSAFPTTSQANFPSNNSAFHPGGPGHSSMPSGPGVPYGNSRVTNPQPIAPNNQGFLPSSTSKAPAPHPDLGNSSSGLAMTNPNFPQAPNIRPAPNPYAKPVATTGQQLPTPSWPETSSAQPLPSKTGNTSLRVSSPNFQPVTGMSANKMQPVSLQSASTFQASNSPLPSAPGSSGNPQLMPSYNVRH